MAFSLVTLLSVSFETFVMAFVALRAGSSRQARFALGVLLALALLTCLNYLQARAADASAAYLLASLTTLTLAGLTIGLLLLFSVMFIPQWWERRRPIVWIALPYLLTPIALAVDLLGRFGWFIGEVQPTATGVNILPAAPSGVVLLNLWMAGLLVVVIVLIVGFVSQPRYRLSIGLLAGALLFAVVAARVSPLLSLSADVAGVLLGLPLRLGLAYLALRTTLLAPNQAGLALAIQAMDTSIAVVGREGLITYSNPAAREAGLTLDRAAESSLTALGIQPEEASALLSGAARQGRTMTLTVGDRIVELTATPICDARGRLRGTLLMGQDTTELVRRNGLLEHERGELSAAIRRLEAEQHERQQLASVVRQLALPVIPVSAGTLILPLIGDFDDIRAHEFLAVLLQAVERQQARLVLLDVTGLTLLDTQGARMLLDGVQAARLLGARCMLIGIRPEIAQTLVALGVEVDRLATAATLQQVLDDVLIARRAEDPAAVSGTASRALRG